MQAEIENVILAYKKEAKSEEKMLMAFLSALAVRSKLRRQITQNLAQGVYDCIRENAKDTTHYLDTKSYN